MPEDYDCPQCPHCLGCCELIKNKTMLQCENCNVEFTMNGYYNLWDIEHQNYIEWHKKHFPEKFK